jgi:hypothetical protein
MVVLVVVELELLEFLTLQTHKDSVPQVELE